MEEKRQWWNVESPNWETRIIDFQRAPAFFLPFLLNGENKENLSSHLERHLNLYNCLLNQGIPAFWRTFGIIGYVLSDDQYELLLEEISGNELVFGLPVEGDSSFLIISNPIDQPNSLPPILNVGSSAVVAAHKGFTLNQGGKKEGNVFRMSTDNRKALYDHKGIPLENLPEGYLLEYLSRNKPLIQGVCGELGLLDVSDLNVRKLNQALAMKIDVNNSTAKKLFLNKQGSWLNEELRNTFFLMNILNQLNIEMYPIDPIGESVIIIFPDYSTNRKRLIEKIEQALKKSSADFPDISFTAVGIVLPNVTIYQTDQGQSVFYGPYVPEETGWYPLEQQHKKQARLAGTLLISEAY